FGQVRMLSADPRLASSAVPAAVAGASRPRMREAKTQLPLSSLTCSRALPPASTLIYSGCRMSSTGERFERAVAIMERLRAPGGCPWDREQTFDSIQPFTLEETYEVLDAIDHRDWGELTQELGDFILQAVFYAQIASEQQLFRIEDALDAIYQKLVRRHPHVFGEE